MIVLLKLIPHKKTVAMKSFRHLIILTALLVLPCLISPKMTYAYLDPGTGSYIIQILIATLAGGTYMIAVSWAKIKTFFRDFISKLSKNRKDEANR